MFNNTSSPTVANCILWGNADAGGMDESAQIHVDSGAPVVTYSLIQGLVLGGDFDDGTNIGDDPLFLDELGPDGTPGTGDEDLRLGIASPAIDAADNTAVPPDAGDLDGDGDTTEPIPFDLDGNPRFVDDPGVDDTGNPDGINPIVDMGAYEAQGCSNDSECDDGVFCNGVETCQTGLCQAGSDPCPGQTCNEANDECTGCTTDSECDDGVFCNGVETCQTGLCQPGSDPCPGQQCDETNDECFTPPPPPPPPPPAPPPSDEDGDGVSDSSDNCPGTTAGAGVDANGCSCDQLDDDGDGVDDCLDNCPADPAKIEPGTCGCGVSDVDTDGDGLIDCLDNCPMTANPDQADGDGNGVGDGCEAGPAGQPNGSCGCGAGSVLLMPLMLTGLGWMRRRQGPRI
jgi:hypothetical protein